MSLLITLDARLDYARFLAEDGALNMAARSLEEVAEELRKAPADRGAQLDALLAGTGPREPAQDAERPDDPHDSVDEGHPCHGDQLEAETCSDPVNLAGSGPLPIAPRGQYSPWGDQPLPARES